MEVETRDNYNSQKVKILNDLKGGVETVKEVELSRIKNSRSLNHSRSCHTKLSHENFLEFSDATAT